MGNAGRRLDLEASAPQPEGMRRLALPALLLLSSCIPRESTVPPSRHRIAAAPATSTLQCFADLRRIEVGFRPLPDQIFDNGCSAVGAVQLLDIGTPVTNLAAMTCPLARQFAFWVQGDVQPAAARWLGSRVTRIESFGTYSCRPIDGRAGNRLSEHGRANAVDVGAFVLADGRRITILAGWAGDDDRVRAFLRAVHDAGCRRFAIVLGPDANADHRNHLHFDMGRGPYCR
jgi:hypothetical protein